MINFRCFFNLFLTDSYSYEVPSQLLFNKDHLTPVNMSGQTLHSPVKTSNLLDKCAMTGAHLQACNQAMVQSTEILLQKINIPFPEH